MKCFIGIVPPSPLYDEIIKLQARFGDNRTEPHITLIPPVEIAEPLKWLPAIQQVARLFSPIPVTLTRTGYFGSRVLFIQAESTLLVQLEARLVSIPGQAISPSKAVHLSYHPHLTLGRLNVGFSQQALQQMEGLANEMLQRPFSFTASALRVYYKPVVQERYKILRDINFGEEQAAG